MPDGKMVEPWGEHPVGRITYDVNGYVTALLMHESRNEAGGQGSLAEIQADYSAYFGSYIVDVEGGIIIHRVAASLSAAHASGEIRRNCTHHNLPPSEERSLVAMLPEKF